jgi:hypothetical protein
VLSPAAMDEAVRFPVPRIITADGADSGVRYGGVNPPGQRFSVAGQNDDMAICHHQLRISTSRGEVSSGLFVILRLQTTADVRAS